MTDRSDDPNAVVDPNQVDVIAQPKKRKRRPGKRKKSRSTPSKAETEAVRERLKARPFSPGVLCEVQSNGAVRYESPHDNADAWDVQIAAAFGTRSASTVHTFLNHLRELTRETYRHDAERWMPNETELNAMLNIINGVQPEDEMQAMLAAQLCATHFLQMRASAYALRSSSFWVEPKNAATVSMLSRTFVKQMEELRKQKRKGDRETIRQEITVIHRTEVHHYDNSQHVHLEGGAGQTGGQVHGTRREPRGKPAVRIEGSATVPSTHPVGKVVPFPGSEGQEGLQVPRGAIDRREG